MAKTVYYETISVMEVPCVMVTAKDYWDRNHFADDGGGPDYEAIRDAMAACGAPETAESAYEIPADGLDALVAGMARLGFRLEKNGAFSAHINGT